MPQTALGARIHQLRWQQRLTVRDLAKKAKVSASTISRIERGRDGSISHLVAIAYGLGVTPRDLLSGLNLRSDLELWKAGDIDE